MSDSNAHTPKRSGSSGNTRHQTRVAYCVFLAATALLAMAAASPAPARATPLDPEQCAVRIPLHEVKSAAQPAIQNALDTLNDAGDFPLNWVNLEFTTIHKDGNRIRFDALLLMGDGAAPLVAVDFRVWIKWVENDVNRDWELCNRDPIPNPNNPGSNFIDPYSSDVYPNYPDFVVDNVACLPTMFDVSLGIFSGIICGVLNHNQPIRRDFKCDIQKDLHEEMLPLLGLTLFESDPDPDDSTIEDDPLTPNINENDPHNDDIGRFRYFFRHLIRDSGGIRLTTDHIYLLLPCIEGCQSPRDGLDQAPKLEDEGLTQYDAQGCTGNAFCVRLRHGDNLPFEPEQIWDLSVKNGYIDLDFRHEAVDIPRYVRDIIQDRVDNWLPTLGAEVLCNHGPSCPAGQDADGDGHCDSVDKCPSTWTTGNYDKDFDGKGDGPGPWALGAQPDQCIDERAWDLEAVARFVEVDEADLPFPIAEEVPAIPSCRRECDNCPQKFNSFQDDADDDGYGDSCDVDIDGDGIFNDYDCDRFNSKVSLDLDRDGACDDQPATWDPVDTDNPHNWCLDECDRLFAELSLGYSNPNCWDKCRPDNCIYDDLESDSSCDGIVPHISVVCEPLLVGERWAGNLRLGYTGLRPCDLASSSPPDFSLCNTVYGNPYKMGLPPYQPDQDGDGIGDRCDLPIVTDLQFYPTEAYQTFTGHSYSVDFKAWGGTAGRLSNGSVGYQSEARTDTRVGACACPVTSISAPNEWDETGLCWSYYCSRNREISQNTNRYYWNPINAPEMDEVLIQGPGGDIMKYPIADESSLYDPIEQNSLFHHRRVRFTLDDQADSHHLTWEWHDAVRLENVPLLQPIGDRYQAEAMGVPGTSIATRVRVVWNQFDPNSQAELPPGSYDGPDRIVTYSDYQLMKETLPSLNPDLQIPELMVPIPLLRVWWDHPRNPMGYLLGHSEVEQTFHVYSLSRSAMQVVDVQRALFTDTPVDDTLLSGVSGAMPQASSADLQAAVFLFQPGHFALSEVVSDVEALPSKLWLGAVSGTTPGQDVVLQTTEERFGTAAPTLFDVALIPFNGHRLLILGSALPGGPQNVLWSLDLGSGQWTGPAILDLPAGIRGLSAVAEPVSNQILLFGGHTASGAAPGAVYLLDPITLGVHAMAGSDTTPSAVPRSQAGVFLDAVGQVLYVYGGQQGSVALTDAWRYSLTSSTWELLGSGDVTAGGPGPALAPLVYHDSVRDVVWVGDFNNANTADGLPVYALSPNGTWRTAHAIGLPSALTWPVDDTFVFGQSRAYPWPTPNTTPLPGSLFLGQISLDAEGLGLKVSAASGSLLGRSDTVTPEVPDAAFRCPSGQRCNLEVKPLPGGGGVRDFTPFLLDVKEAAPVLRVERNLPGQITDLTLYGDLLVAASPAGLWTLDHRSLTIQGQLGLHPITSLVACGGYLCVSKLGLHGLTVLGLSDPASPRVLGSSFSPGLGWDVAASGQRAFVAHGVLGVGIYDVSTQGQPAHKQTIWTGGLVRTVAVQQNLLVAGCRQGGITLYDTSAVPVQVGSIQAQGQISRVRFVAGQLWVLDKHESWVEIWDVSTPSAPVRLGSFSAEAAWHFRALFLGASVLSFDGKKVQRHDLVPVGP